MKLFEHEHPLKLVDLQVNNEELEESDVEEEEEDTFAQDEFACSCKRCDQPINEYYRYYFKCVDDSCHYDVHKFCAEAPTTLKFTSHPHPLTLTKYPPRSHFLTLPEYTYDYSPGWACLSCGSKHKPYKVCYMCVGSFCYFPIDISCGVEGDKKRIQHPSHPHPLVPLISKPILCECTACGIRHEGVFFQCITCPTFAIHTDCAFLPKRLLIQQTTKHSFHHTHPLTLSYSFPDAEQEAKYNPTCRVCNGSFYLKEHLWIYKCEKCIYYAHLDCATSSREPFMSMLHQDRGQMIKNFKDDDYPDLFPPLPFPNQSYSVPQILFFKEVGTTTFVSLPHTTHHHELILVNTKYKDGASSSSEISLCHNPMKKIQLLCNVCVRPIMNIPFYKCGANEDQSCTFALHEWCTRLPQEVVNHPGHPQHPLVLMPNISGPNELFNIFFCAVCRLHCNGYAYGCVECHYYIDVTCGFIPERITHESHPYHLLRVKESDFGYRCIMCLDDFDISLYSPHSSDTLPPCSPLCFSCDMCEVYIHPECALSLSRTITHAYDKHPMKLSYLPIENHKSEYFCEICENELNPHRCFYHCDKCSQSVHSACAPLILCCETETYSQYFSSIYSFLKVKFGSIHKIPGHPHPLLFVQGIESDGQCSVCYEEMRYEMIYKCDTCKFAIDYRCCQRLKNNP